MQIDKELSMSQKQHMPSDIRSGAGSSQLFLVDALNSIRIARSISCAVKIGIAEVLKEGPKTVDEIATATGTHAPSLYRLLRALASVDIFAEVATGTFEQTERSTLLLPDVPGSVHGLALLSETEFLCRSWEALELSVRTGRTAFEQLYGANLWDYLTQHSPEDGRLFSRAMTSRSELFDMAIATAYDFSSMHTIADIGGGRGSQLVTILRQNPHMSGWLFDRAPVIAEAEAYLSQANLRERCTLLVGDFFEAVPAGADVYFLKQVIHNWDDLQSVQILRNIRMAMKPQSKVLIVDPVILPGKDSQAVKFFDLQMLVLFSGKERTEEEYRYLYASAGIKLTRIIPTCSVHSPVIVEGVAMEEK